MADPSGFLKYTHQELPKRRPVPLRLKDWNEVYEEFDNEILQHRRLVAWIAVSRSPQTGVRWANLIPEWNDLVRRGRFRDAIRALARHQQHFPRLHRPAVSGAV